MELAKRVESVTAVDITEKMLEQARRLAAETGIKNLTFDLADAANLPYEPRSFNIVTCRRAAHHFKSIPHS